MSRAITAALTAILLQAPLTLAAASGVYYEAVSEIQLQPDTGRTHARVTGESWVKDGKAKIRVTGSDSRLVEEGTWLLTHDGGETVYRVDPRAETVQALGVKALTENMYEMLESLSGQAGIEFGEPTAEKLLEEPGPEILGYATVHTVHRMSYSIGINIGDLEQVIETSLRREQWTTPALDFPLAGVWMGMGATQTGMNGMGQLMSELGGDTAGFPLKTMVETRTTVQDRVSVSRSTTEVTKVEERDIDDAVFEIPPGFDRVRSPAFRQTLPQPGE